MLPFYLLKSYQQNLKEKQYNYPTGFSLFTPFKKVLFVFCMLLNVLSLVVLGVISFGRYEYKNILTYGIGFFGIFNLFVLLFALSGEKKAKFQYEYLKYNQKLDILLGILKEYKFNSEKSIKEILNSINHYLDRKNKKLKLEIISYLYCFLHLDHYLLLY